MSAGHAFPRGFSLLQQRRNAAPKFPSVLRHYQLRHNLDLNDPLGSNFPGDLENCPEHFDNLSRPILYQL
jgi:hypothetical protein